MRWLCVSLLATNLATAFFALKAYFWSIPLMVTELEATAIVAGAACASIDFANGKTRQFQAVALPPDGKHSYDPEASSASLPFVEDWPGSRISTEAYVRSYNGRMQVLIKRRDNPPVDQ
jgi:hypothetical protein